MFASRVVATSCWVAPTLRVAVAGETETVATGTGAGALTVIVALPVFPSLVAITWVVPAALPVTTPVPLTDAIALLALLHATARPVMTLPLASRVIAMTCAVAPTLSATLAGETSTVATGTGGGG